jgi:hypothetical protein
MLGTYSGLKYWRGLSGLGSFDSELVVSRGRVSWGSWSLSGCSFPVQVWYGMVWYQSGLLSHLPHISVVYHLLGSRRIPLTWSQGDVGCVGVPGP